MNKDISCEQGKMSCPCSKCDKMSCPCRKGFTPGIIYGFYMERIFGTLHGSSHANRGECGNERVEDIDIEEENTMNMEEESGAHIV